MPRIHNHPNQNKSAENFSAEVYQLRIWLRKISPTIWRRILVRSDSSIADLHYTLQIAMGWSDTYLHQFVIHGKKFGIAKDGGIWFPDDPTQVLLKNFHFSLNQRFIYEYNFFDRWVHEIRVEKCIAFDPGRTYPVCIDGSRSTPPEDCGGPWKFMTLRQQYNKCYLTERLMEILEGGKIDNYEEISLLKYWASIDRFDRGIANKRLKQYVIGDEAWMYE